MTKTVIREGLPRPKIGVVLGSGGVKSMGSIQLFEELSARNIPIDLIVGCSGGAVVGSVIAMGSTPKETRLLATTLYTPEIFAMNYKALGGMLKIPFMKFDESMAIFNGLPLEKAFRKMYQNRFIEEAQIPLLIQATDLQTGEGVVLSTGDCAKAVQASSAAVPFLPPCMIDGRWMIDGAFSQALPIMEAVKANMDIIIAMSFDEMPTEKPTNFLSLAAHVLNKAQRNAIYTQTGRAISFHHHEIVFIPLVFDHPINLWEATSIPLIFDGAKKIVDQSMQYIEKAIDDFYELKGS